MEEADPQRMPDTSAVPPPLDPPLSPSDLGLDVDPAADTQPAAPPAPTDKRFPCSDCGAKLVYKPGSTDLACPYCGAANHIPTSEAEIIELDFDEHLETMLEAQPEVESRVIKCTACAAEASYPEHAASIECAFCGANIVATETAKRLHKPQSLLPFKIRREEARSAFRRWTKKLWFAPNNFKKRATIDSKINGIYVPYWTYDTNTVTVYSGQRGDHYYVTRTVNGKTQRERRTRWRHASGTVWDTFDDVLVLASQSLPRKQTEKLEPWDLHELKPYDSAFLSGFGAESYTIDLGGGFDLAKQLMDPRITGTIKADIGGDAQRIHSKKTQYNDVTFKHLLLPIWLSTYRYNDKPYRFLVNGRTGEVQGERPWSWIKITLATLGGLATAGGIALVSVFNGH